MRTFIVGFGVTAFLALSPCVVGQRLSVGVIGGASLTDSFESQSFPSGSIFGPVAILHYSTSKDYIVGPTLELKLTPHWLVEVDGMYRKLHFTTAALLANGSLNSVSPSPVITWEFPVLAKYRFALWKVKPFAEAGPSFRTAGNLNGTNPSHAGFTSGVGVEVQAGRLKIVPVLRYTRWAGDKTFGFLPNSAPDQVEGMVGFSLSPESQWRPLGRHFSVGAVGGTTLTDDLRVQDVVFRPGFFSSSRPVRSLIAGAAVEVELGKHLSVEANALYHPLRGEYVTTVDGKVGRPSRSGIATWELPLLAKGMISSRFGKPFVEGGPSFRLPASGLSNYGVTGGVGFESRLRLFKIAPMVRYTHWAADGPLRRTGAVRNQVEVLVGISL